MRWRLLDDEEPERVRARKKLEAEPPEEVDLPLVELCDRDLRREEGRKKMSEL